MRMPRITIRRMMIFVALTALIFTGSMATMRGGPLSGTYRQKAADHAAKLPGLNTVAELHANAARACRERAESHRNSGRTEDAASSTEQATYWDRSVAALRERANYHDRMRRKWAYAVRYPWLPVEPDPPAPK